MSSYILGHDGLEKVIGTRREEAPPRPRLVGGEDVRPQPATPPGMIDTTAFAGKCQTRTEWPVGSPHPLQLVSVRWGELSDEVRRRLLAEGVGPWVDSDEPVELGETVCLSLFGAGTFGPAPSIPLSEIVGRIKSGPPLAERREQHRLELERLQRQEAEKRAERDRLEAEKMEALRRAEEAKDERRRRLSPAYCLRKMEELAGRLLGTKST